VTQHAPALHPAMCQLGASPHAPLRVRRLAHGTGVAKALLVKSFVACSFVCLAVAGCSSEVVGTGGSSSSGGRGGNQDPLGTSGTAEAEVPEEVKALFAAPESSSVTPNSIFGVWANDEGTGYQVRLTLTTSEITVAQRCSYDGRIAWVTSKIRANESNITVLETKSMRLEGSCNTNLEVEVAEWRVCDSTGYDYDCFKVEGTALTGLTSSFSTQYTRWVKLSD
jgi:hypothetical protein